eukprot:4935140-Amphidinium_carterae.3
MVDLCIKGFRVVFDKDETSGADASYVQHRKARTRVPFQRKGRTWELVLDLQAWAARVRPNLQINPLNGDGVEGDELEEVAEDAVQIARRAPEDLVKSQCRAVERPTKRKLVVGDISEDQVEVRGVKLTRRDFERGKELF